ncbi:MAG TPA: DUF4922 domain-containing protein [Candidatus Coprenecus merdigallinarum]|nr:DUF4922 domain-containing protein [Candidatus Coprenecus merdigallinarum]
MHNLFDRQLAAWPEAARRYRDLQNIETREIDLGGMPVRIQFNPARAVSTLARTDAAAIKARPCFLCRGNRPRQQEALPFEGCDGRRYEVLVNPFPIFPEHYTVPAVEHTPQRIAGRFPDMLRLADAFPDMVVFYNGPESGASAPDHFHFQMGCRGFLPVETHFDRLRPVTVMRPGRASISVTSGYISGLPVITAPDEASATAAFLRVLRSLPVSPATGEPQLNILCWRETPAYGGSGALFHTLVIPRKAHRPSCYFAPEDRAVRISPASVDLGGVFIVPVEADFRRVNAQVLRDIIEETVDTSWQPVIDVGLLTAPQLRVRFNQPFTGPDSRKGGICGEQAFTLADGMVEWNGKRYGRLEFRPAGSAPEEGDSRGFTLHKVRIGINFHWEREEDQLFSGGLTILPSEEGLVAINSVLTEDYLLSVISSEMNGDAPEEFLKAHAVISRSWLLARPTLGGGDNAHGSEGSRHSAAANGDNPDSQESPGNGHSGQGISAPGSLENDRIIRWYDREDHTLFDVCADDHCQRYQGLLRAGNANIRRAIEATRGLVLTDGPDGAICDTRFSKCCGGVSERFSACWADEDYAYLQPVRDYACLQTDEDNAADDGTPVTVGTIPDLSDEQNAREWILSSPEAFCNTSDPALLSTVLNSYDQETADFYRWRVEYTQEELSDLLRRRSGIDFGSVLELRPLRRGASGRIIELLIRGTLRTVTVGKELEIRRWLSESHLYSSAFVVDTVYAEPASDGQDIRPGINAPAIPTGFILHGAGWGHGVGLCQIGAAAMSARGCTFDRILAHYFRGSCLTRLY